MLNFQYTSSTVNMQIMNQFHTHSQKKQNPAKKFIKSGQIEIMRRRRRWDRAVKVRSEARSVRSSDERRDRRAHSQSRSMSVLAIAIDERARRTIAPLVDRQAVRSSVERARWSRRLSRRSSDDCTDLSSAAWSQHDRIWWIFLLGFAFSVNECGIDSLFACLQLRKCMENWACKAFSVKMFEWTKHRN